MKDTDYYRTPRKYWDSWNIEYGFTVDAAAGQENALCEKYWSEQDSGLVHSWAGEVVWCNPPYSQGELYKWVYKAAKREAWLAVLLIPSSTDTQWFRDCIWSPQTRDWYTGVHVEFMKRIAFDNQYGQPTYSPRTPIMKVEFHG